jgi:hypothetical protein
MIGDLLNGKPINNQDAMGIASDLFAAWNGIGAAYRPPIDAHGQTAHGRSAPFVPFGGWPGAGRPWSGGSPPPPRMDPQEQARLEAIARARKTMGFTDAERLNEDTISDRRKRLARKHHPDFGGSLERMKIINDAADVLLASLSQ